MGQNTFNHGPGFAKRVSERNTGKEINFIDKGVLKLIKGVEHLME